MDFWTLALFFFFLASLKSKDPEPVDSSPIPQWMADKADITESLFHAILFGLEFMGLNCLYEPVDPK